MGTEGNWGQPIIALTAFFLPLVLIVLALRIFSRVYLVHAFWWDDATIILAVVRPKLPPNMTCTKASNHQLGTTIGAALDFVEVHYGFGKHARFLTPHELRQFRKYTYGEWIQTFATLMWTKVSICLFLIRIPQSRALKRPLQWAVAFLLLSNAVLTVMLIMQCQPLHAAWDDRVPGGGRCLSLDAKMGIVLAQAVISVVSDFAFAALPVFFLWRTQIDLKTKIGLWLLMGLGVITGALCLVRTVINDQSFPDDESYGGIVNWVWRLFEVSIGIIAACVPTLRPFYTWAMMKMKGGSNNTTGERNIKFPLGSSDKPHHHPWDGTVDAAKHARRREEDKNTPANNDPSRHATINRHQHQHHGTWRDTLGEELVREGIITDQPEKNTLPPPSSSSTPPGCKGESALDQEMHKYGIDDSTIV
ncbi:MAG: hypothetical protein LQ344_004300 [Seirophora lacunosa]|nr:MAG: hypothetical protein LQ344_004300 [Seirophora lacunosa]